MAEGSDNTGRDARGRFTAGNPGGPGNPHGKRSAALRRAALEAIGPEHVAAIIRLVTRKALEGNLGAVRLVLDRVCGRAAESPREAEPIPITIPPLQTARDCNVAIDRMIQGIAEGVVDHDAARLLIDAIQARLKAIEVQDLEARLTELEDATSAVDGVTRLRRVRRE